MTEELRCPDCYRLPSSCICNDHSGELWTDEEEVDQLEKGREAREYNRELTWSK